MQNDTPWGTIGDHLMISLGAWLIAILVGGGLGYLIARLIHRWSGRSAVGWPWLALIPWRAISAWISLVAFTDPFAQIRFGLRNTSEIYTLGIILLVWAVPGTAQVYMHQWFERSFPSRICSTIRTWAIVAIALTATSVYGIGFLIYRGKEDWNFQLLNQGYALVALTLLIVDFLIGALQFRLSRRRVPVVL